MELQKCQVQKSKLKAKKCKKKERWNQVKADVGDEA